jgi:hypothetical protein
VAQFADVVPWFSMAPRQQPAKGTTPTSAFTREEVSAREMGDKTQFAETRRASLSLRVVVRSLVQVPTLDLTPCRGTP